MSYIPAEMGELWEAVVRLREIDQGLENVGVDFRLVPTSWPTTVAIRNIVS
jgi:hypothetical protein